VKALLFVAVMLLAVTAAHSAPTTCNKASVILGKLDEFDNLIGDSLLPNQEGLFCAAVEGNNARIRVSIREIGRAHV